MSHPITILIPLSPVQISLNSLSARVINSNVRPIILAPHENLILGTMLERLIPDFEQKNAQSMESGERKERHAAPITLKETQTRLSIDWEYSFEHIEMLELITMGCLSTQIRAQGVPYSSMKKYVIQID